MSTYVKTIKDGNSDIIYPQTKTQAIFNNDSKNLQTILDNKNSTQSTTITLLASSWNLNAQIILINGVTDSNHVVVTPAPSDVQNWGDYNIKCSRQGNGWLAFKCDETPENNISVNILIFDPVSSSTPVTIVNKPTVVVEPLYYTGSAQGPTITGLDNNMTVTGATATQIGTYTLTISLKNQNMIWNDGSVEDLVYQYSIDEELIQEHIYGVYWDGSSTTTWSRTDDSADFVDPEPAVNNGDGSSPFDNLLPWSGMVREQISSCGTMVKIPKFWYKWTRDGSSMKLQIADYAADGFYVSPAHADRGDGSGQRDYVYVGAYHCATSTYKSTTGVKPAVSATRATFRANIHNLGSNVWQYDYAMYWTICMLYLVEFADWNSQAKIGYGCGNNSSTENMGSTDSMTYHTGTNASSRTTYGHIRYRYIEGLWDNVYDWCDGIYFSSSNVYCIKNPSSFSDSSGGTLIGTRSTSSNYISAWTNPTVSGFEYALYPNAVNGSEITYITDFCNYGSPGVVLRVGGSYYQNQFHGLFYLDGYYQASRSHAVIGSRPMLLP